MQETKTKLKDAILSMCEKDGKKLDEFIKQIMTKGAISQNNNKSINNLKNALLSLFLLLVCKKDIDKNRDYTKYNGSKLPPFSGNSIENALMSYIISKDTLATSGFSSKTMVDHQDAINKYLNKKLNNDKKISKLFNKFMKDHIITKNYDLFSDKH